MVSYILHNLIWIFIQPLHLSFIMGAELRTKPQPKTKTNLMD